MAAAKPRPWANVAKLMERIFARLAVLEERVGVDGQSKRAIASTRTDGGRLIVVFDDGTEKVVGQVVPGFST